MSEAEVAGDLFDAKVVQSTTSTIKIQWRAVESATVYKIEQHFKRSNWTQVGWTAETSCLIERLEDNFCFLFRISALQYHEEQEEYTVLTTSVNVPGCTQASPPSAQCFYRAIRKGQEFLVKRLLRRRPSLIDYPANNGYYPLANAIWLGEMGIVDILLTAGANIHIGNAINKRTPLHVAFFHGNLSVVRMLLNKKANLDANDIIGMTPPHYAVDADRFDCLKYALDNGADLESKDKCGYTLLLRAVVMNASPQIVKLLILQGADMDAEDAKNLSFTQLAKLNGNQEVLQFVEHYKMRNVEEGNGNDKE